VDPLVVAGGLGEHVDLILFDPVPVAVAEMLTGQIVELLDALHGGSHAPTVGEGERGRTNLRPQGSDVYCEVLLRPGLSTSLARPAQYAGPVALEHHHRNIQGGGARAAVFGVSDGLVSNVALILGMAGAHASAGAVRLAGLAGLIGGAFSMAAGEYVSMRAQSELMQRELDVERQAIHHDPEDERRELAAIYESRGLDSGLAEELSVKMMRSPELALETHAREELGIDPQALGKPLQAASSSFATFAVGAVLPLLPWLVARGTGAVIASIAVGAVAALGVGAALAVFTRRSVWKSAIRQLLLSAVGAAVAYGVGSAVGVSGVG
jgi:VIT1/CCC1 family predicted Fe2+/Mn2+ transporter